MNLVLELEPKLLIYLKIRRDKRKMEGRDFLYSTIKRDIHQLGIDLSQQYKNIRIAYDVFLVGLVVFVIAFGLCHVLF